MIAPWAVRIRRASLVLRLGGFEVFGDRARRPQARQHYAQRLLKQYFGEDH